MEKEKRTYISDIKKSQEVLLEGWVHDLRDLAKIKFVLLRDATGVVQCVINQESLFKKFLSLSLESVILIKGRARDAQVKSLEVSRNELEVEIKEFQVLEKAEPLPLNIKGIVESGLAKRLDYRYLDIRNNKIKAIFKIQSEVSEAFREFFYSRGYIEIQPPAIIAASSEGGTELFPVKYFEKPAFLAQSPQLYKQLMAISLEKVFAFMPIWRAEKHNTPRHLNEIRQMDIEQAFVDDMEIMRIQEECIQFLVKRVLEKCKQELKLLNVSLKIPKAKYLSYKEAIELLQKNKLKIQDGDDLSPEAEKKLNELFPDTIIFVYEWPLSLKPFYIWPKTKDLSAGFDSIYGGMEISSGGQRIHKPDILTERLRAKGLKPKDFTWYIDAFKYGAPFHSGWSIGLERFTQALLGLDNIREACLFPRDRERLIL